MSPLLQPIVGVMEADSQDSGKVCIVSLQNISAKAGVVLSIGQQSVRKVQLLKIILEYTSVNMGVVWVESVTRQNRQHSTERNISHCSN